MPICSISSLRVLPGYIHVFSSAIDIISEYECRIFTFEDRTDSTGVAVTDAPVPVPDKAFPFLCCGILYRWCGHASILTS